MRTVFPSVLAQARWVSVDLRTAFTLEHHSLSLALDSSGSLTETETVDGPVTGFIHVEVIIRTIGTDFALDLHRHRHCSWSHARIQLHTTAGGCRHDGSRRTAVGGRRDRGGPIAILMALDISVACRHIETIGHRS